MGNYRKLINDNNNDIHAKNETNVNIRSRFPLTSKEDVSIFEISTFGGFGIIILSR